MEPPPKPVPRPRVRPDEDKPPLASATTGALDPTPLHAQDAVPVQQSPVYSRPPLPARDLKPKSADIIAAVWNSIDYISPCSLVVILHRMMTPLPHPACPLAPPPPWHPLVLLPHRNPQSTHIFRSHRHPSYQIPTRRLTPGPCHQLSPRASHRRTYIINSNIVAISRVRCLYCDSVCLPLLISFFSFNLSAAQDTPKAFLDASATIARDLNFQQIPLRAKAPPAPSSPLPPPPTEYTAYNHDDDRNDSTPPPPPPPPPNTASTDVSAMVEVTYDAVMEQQCDVLYEEMTDLMSPVSKQAAAPTILTNAPRAPPSRPRPPARPPMPIPRPRSSDPSVSDNTYEQIIYESIDDVRAKSPAPPPARLSVTPKPIGTTKQASVRSQMYGYMK
jgi:hypothetical protein